MQSCCVGKLWMAQHVCIQTDRHYYSTITCYSLIPSRQWLSNLSTIYTQW
jgi:hypothetical protein